MIPQDLLPSLLAVATLVCANVSSAASLTDALITEFLAVNDLGIADEDGDRSDWLEIWNTSGVNGDLGSWYLTDDPANLTKWLLPAVELDAGARLVVFASSKNRSAIPGELHTNFKLQSAAGGYLALVKPDGTTVASGFTNYPAQLSDVSYGSGYATLGPTTMVQEGAAAKWLVPTGPVADWTTVGFDDSTWSSANLGIGYDEDNDYQTHFGAGGDVGAAMSGNATIYIRVPFSVTNPTAISDLILRMKWEDGFVAHLNGTEIHRERASGVIDWNSTSDNGSRDDEEAVIFADYPLVGSLLVTGANVLSIQGLNTSTGSSDIIISPELVGTEADLTSPNDGFFPEPTPGESNGARYDGITADTKFSVDRGLYPTPFDLLITTATPGASIRYTTDGTPPDESTGQLYGGGPIPISQTTVIRAIAYLDGFRSTNIDTHTYLFPADVVTQPAMDTAITQDPVYGPQMIGALTSIPTIALSFDGADIDRTEIPISVELLNFESGAKQVNAGAARFGSLVTDFEKRSFRLHFRSLYGASRLEFPLFEEADYKIPPTNDFDSLDIRAGNHDMIDRGAYLSNRFTDDAMLEMGNLSAHGRFVHVYFNGLYHGHYHLRERWDAAMASDYLPGTEAEFDTINANNSGRQFGAPNLQALQDGDLTDWIAMRDLIDNSPNPYSATKGMLDVANLIDFMLLWTMGDSESEFRAAGSVENGVGFKFFIKDADGFLRAPNDTHHNVDHNGPLNAMTAFRTEGDPDFMILLADRIHQHFFNGGALTPERNIARLQHRVDEMSLSYIAEVARRRFIISPSRTSTNRTPPQWLAYHQNIIDNRFPTLTEARLNKLRAANMYPDIIAPVLSQHGGSIPTGAAIRMRTDATEIYYTLDGTDPRLQGGTLNPAATQAPFDPTPPSSEDLIVSGDHWKFLDDGSDQGTAWRAANFDDNTWASGPSELGYGDGDEAQIVSFVDTNPAQAGSQRNATTYFRREFTVGSPSAFTHFLLGLKYDDGAAVYVNGVEAVRTANLAADPAYNEFASSGTPGESTFYDFTVPSAMFSTGANIIAVEVHNMSAGSSDISFDLTLSGVVDPSSGPNATLPISLTEAGPLQARGYNSATGEWSALTETFFSIDTVPPSSTNLVIAEIHYHPAEPVSAGELTVSSDRDDFEFVELLNIGSQPVELTDLNFSAGITFAFAENTFVNAGERVVIARNAAAFAARYGAVDLAGVYSGRLSNDGEQLTLSVTGGGTIAGVLYNDVLDWPTLADGVGYSMVLIDPETNPDDDVPSNWAAHSTVGGSPGAADTTQPGYGNWKGQFLVTDDASDDDGDGMSALLEYALGTSPTVTSVDALPFSGVTTVGGEEYLTISFQENPLATDLIYRIQRSVDLTTWETITPIEVSPNVFRSTNPIPASRLQFLRLVILVQ